MVVIGVKSEDNSMLVSRKYTRIIQKLGFDVKFSEFKPKRLPAAATSSFLFVSEGLRSAVTSQSLYLRAFYVQYFLMLDHSYSRV